MSDKKAEEESVTKSRKDVVIQTITALDEITTDTQSFAFKTRVNQYVLEHMTKITLETKALNEMVVSILDIISKVAGDDSKITASVMDELKESLEAIENKYQTKEEIQSKT